MHNTKKNFLTSAISMYALKNSSLIPIRMKGVFSQKGLLCSPVFSTYTFLSFLFLLVGLALSLDLGIMKKVFHAINHIIHDPTWSLALGGRHISYCNKKYSPDPVCFSLKFGLL